MKKFRNVCALVLCLALAMFSGCGDKKKPPEPINPPEPNASHRVTVKDQNGNLLEGFWLELYYIDENYTLNVVKDAMSGKNGKAYFTDFEAKEGIDYRVRSKGVYGEKKRAIPYTYLPQDGEVAFDEEGNAEFIFTYQPQRFPGGDTTLLAYAREDVDGTPTETENTPLITAIEANGEIYFAFSPYAAPETVAKGQEKPDGGRYTEEEALAEAERRIQAATTAATGRYEISYTVSPAADVTFRLYAGTRASMPLDPETGKPKSTQVQETAQKGENKLTVHLNSLHVRGECIFGLSSATATTATVTVRRVGDATEPVLDEQTMHATATQPWTQVGADIETLINMPLDGTKTAVLGDDGFYHLGSKDGALIYAQFGNKMSRLGDYAIVDMRNQTNIDKVPLGDNAYIFSWMEADESAYHVHKYHEFVNEYAALLNPDGAHPVNEEIKNFLNLLVPNTLAAAEITNMKNAWMAACQYYGKIEGSKRSPIELSLNAVKEVDIATYGLEKVYVRYTAAEAGVYSISASKSNTATFSPADALDAYNAYSGGYYAVLAEGDALDCMLEGKGSMTVMALKVDTMWAASEGHGDTEDTAFSAVEGINPFRTGESGVYVAFTPADNEDYRIDPGKDVTLTYDGQTYTSSTPLEIENKKGVKLVLHVESQADTALFIVRKLGSFRADTPKNMSIEAYGDPAFTFTAPKSGLYTVRVTTDDQLDEWSMPSCEWVTVSAFDNSDVRYIKAGESEQFVVYNNDMMQAHTVTVTVVTLDTLAVTQKDEAGMWIPATPQPVELKIVKAGVYKLTVDPPRNASTLVSQVFVTIGDDVYVLDQDSNWQTLIDVDADTTIAVQGDAEYFLLLEEVEN